MTQESPRLDGPRLVAEVEAHGIDAVRVESFSIVTDTRSLMRNTSGKPTYCRPASSPTPSADD